MELIRNLKSTPRPRHWLALLMAIAMVATFASTSFAAGGSTFSDVSPYHWAYDYVEKLVQKEIIKGYGDGTFGPNDNLGRDQVAKMITLATGLEADLPEGNNVTRLQIAQIVVDAFDLTEGEEDVTFTDLDALGADARGYIQVLASNGIVNGYSDGTFAPNAYITRAQFTKILSLAMKVTEEAGVPVEEAEVPVLGLPTPRKDENASDKYVLDNSNINAENLASYLNRSDVVYIDLREYEDYKTSHLSGFVNIPFNSYIFNVDAHTDTTKTNLYGGSATSPVSVFVESDETLELLIPRETDKSIFFFCQSGARVANMLRILDAKGYDTSKMYNVGGMGQYSAEVYNEFKLSNVDGTNLTDQLPTANFSR